MTRTTIVIPVRGGVGAKSRLGHDHLRPQLARAMALDTIEAALAVAPVIVVTDETMRADAAHLGATVVTDPGHGLIPAIAAGLAVALASENAGATAVLLGDLPGLDPSELAAALTAAAAHDRAMVADADAEGTVLVVARAGVEHRLAFGAGSRAAHLANGYSELSAPWPTLRRDVDRPEHLRGVARGARTLELLGGLSEREG
jgi:2-phospho-L-lactate/phosphoenolpyruvate guanylyltransferase